MVTNAVIIENKNNNGYNFGGICFWNNNTDGVTTIQKTVNSIGAFGSDGN